MGFFAFANFFALRVCLNVAITVMVNSTYLRELEAAAAAANVSINNSSDLYHKYDHASSTTHDDDDVRIASK